MEIMTLPNKPPSRYLLILVTLIGALYFLSYYDYGVNLWDEGVPLSGALRMDAGQRPARDFTAYPPGRYFLYQAALYISGGSVTGPRVVLACLSGLICLFLFRISAYFLPYRFCWFPVGFYLLMPFMYYYRFLTFFLLMSILMLITLTKHRISPLEAVLVGAGGILVIWFREFLGIALTTFAFGLLIYKAVFRRHQKLTWQDWFTPFVMGLAWISRIIYIGGIRRFLDLYRYSLNVATEGHSGMQLPWPNVFSIGFWRDSGFFYGMEDLLIWVAGFIVLSGVVAGFMRFRDRREWWILCGVASLGYCLVVWRTGYGNLQRIIPPVIVMATVLVWEKKVGIKRRAGILSAVIARSFYLLFFLFICVDSLIVNSEVYHSIGMKRIYDNQLKIPHLQVNCDRRNADVLSTVNTSLQSIIKPGGGLVCLPFHTIWNFTTGEINPTAYEWLLPGMFTDPRRREEMFHEFQSRSPDVILLNDTGFDNISQRAFSRQYPELFGWLRREYYRWMVINEFEIFKHLPSEAIKMLDVDSWNEISLARGQNRVDKLHLGLDEWSVLWQKGFGEVTFSRNVYHPGDVLKTGVLLRQEPSDRFIEGVFTILLVDESGTEHELNRTQLKSTDHPYDEILIYITQDQTMTGHLVLRSESTDSGDSGWIEPLIFQWPETKSCIDTERSSN